MQVESSRSEPRFGPWQGLWLMLGYLAAQFLGSLLVYFAWGLQLGLQALLHHHRLVSFPKPGTGVLAWAVLIGFLSSALWVAYYLRRLARPLLSRGDVLGIAWRAAPLQAYGAALLAALAALAFAACMAMLLPPDPAHLKGPLSRLLSAPGWPRLTVLLLAVAGAPLMEEVLFRGALFAALARRLSVLQAGAVTTLVFVALHAPDKLGWWPGFLVVGVLGALLIALRLRYRSLWPGMLTHFLYNVSLFLPALGLIGTS